MKYLADLQHRFGFTQNEIIMILFLSLSLLAGMGISWLRTAEGVPGGIRPAFDYTRSDSEFIARSTLQLDDTPSGPSAAARHPFPKKEALPPASIDINTASHQEFTRLPGVGDAIARRIVAYRDDNGPFSSVDELRNVHGIGNVKLEKMRPFIRAGGLR